MIYPWLDKYLLNKKAVTKDFKAEWNWDRYMIDGKMFVAVCYDDTGKAVVYITLKLLPEEGQFLRSQHTDIIPGYYMNKTHWNSVKADGNISDDLLKYMLDQSYNLILKSLSNKKQKELLGE